MALRERLLERVAVRVRVSVAFLLGVAVLLLRVRLLVGVVEAACTARLEDDAVPAVDDTREGVLLDGREAAVPVAVARALPVAVVLEAAVPVALAVPVPVALAVPVPVALALPVAVVLEAAVPVALGGAGVRVGVGVAGAVGEAAGAPPSGVRYTSNPCTIESAVEESTMSAPRGPQRRPKKASVMLIEISAQAPGAMGASASGTLAQGMRTTAAAATGTVAAVVQPAAAS